MKRLQRYLLCNCPRELQFKDSPLPSLVVLITSVLGATDTAGGIHLVDGKKNTHTYTNTCVHLLGSLDRRAMRWEILIQCSAAAFQVYLRQALSQSYSAPPLKRWYFQAEQVANPTSLCPEAKCGAWPHALAAWERNIGNKILASWTSTYTVTAHAVFCSSSGSLIGTRIPSPSAFVRLSSGLLTKETGNSLC